MLADGSSGRKARNRNGHGSEMVEPMTEQSGCNEPAEQQGSAGQGSDRQGSDRPATDGAGSGRSARERPESARPVSARPASGQSGADRQRQSAPGADMLSDLQRWLIRSGAKSMRKEITGQVRRTFSSGQRSATSNVWDTATTEIPPDAGESPECQWCPICRAARLMRESGPGIGGQLSGAGEVVASAVQDAVSALDSILGKAGGSRVSDSRGGQSRAGQPRTGQPGAGAGERPGFGDSEPAGPHGAAHDRHDDAAPHGSAAGDHGPGGWKPGDRLATAQSAEPDAWAAATEPDDGGAAGGQPDAESGSPSAGEDESQLDGQGHEPDDRG